MWFCSTMMTMCFTSAAPDAGADGAPLALPLVAATTARRSAVSNMTTRRLVNVYPAGGRRTTRGEGAYRDDIDDDAWSHARRRFGAAWPSRISSLPQTAKTGRSPA